MTYDTPFPYAILIFRQLVSIIGITLFFMRALNDIWGPRDSLEHESESIKLIADIDLICR